jgi:hypothetical protein
MYFYIATDLDLGPQKLDEDETIHVYPTPFKEALAMVRRNVIMDAKTVVGLLFYEQFEQHLR